MRLPRLRLPHLRHALRGRSPYMMQSLLGRWFGEPSKPVGTPALAAATSPAVQKSVQAPNNEGAPTVGARQALVDLRGKVVGYEFSLGSIEQAVSVLVRHAL